MLLRGLLVLILAMFVLLLLYPYPLLPLLQLLLLLLLLLSSSLIVDLPTGCNGGDEGGGQVHQAIPTFAGVPVRKSRLGAVEVQIPTRNAVLEDPCGVAVGQVYIEHLHEL